MRSFAGIRTFNYIGIPIRVPIVLCAPTDRSNNAAVMEIDWNTYWQLAANVANVGVEINLRGYGNTQGAVIPRVMSVYIDNLNSAIPIYVRFPDTGYTIVAPANTATWYPAVTNEVIATVYAIGLQTNFIPFTKIYFCDVLIQPFNDTELAQAVALYRASPTITRGESVYNTNYGVPALGDQIFNIFSRSTIIPPATEVTFPFANSPEPSGEFYYITHYLITISAWLCNNPNTLTWYFESTGASGIVFQNSVFFSGSANDPFQFQTLVSLQGMQIKLDASETWRVRVARSGLGAQNDFTFSENIVYTQSVV